MSQPDLFGNAPAQRELFAEVPRAEREWIVNADTIRPKMLALLETARNAQTMPWPQRRAGVYEIIFPQMANWLPDEEANQLRFAFAQELERLKLAA